MTLETLEFSWSYRMPVSLHNISRKLMMFSMIIVEKNEVLQIDIFFQGYTDKTIVHLHDV